MFSNQNKNNVVHDICLLAKNRDEVGITKLLNKVICINIFQSNYNPVILLAKEGDQHSVNFLVNKFNASFVHAIRGYAWGNYLHKIDKVNILDIKTYRNACVWGRACGGYVDEVNHLLRQGAAMHHAIQGYTSVGNVDEANKLIASSNSFPFNISSAIIGSAWGGYVDQVNALVARGGIYEDALAGYACGGYVDEVNNLITRGLDVKQAIWGYACGGHVQEVNHLINQHCYEKAKDGYEWSGALELSNIVNLLVHTDDENLRIILSKKAFSFDLQDLSSILLEKTNTLRRIIKEYEFNFSQAIALNIPGMRDWYLQGSQLIDNNIISKDIFFLICCYVVQLPIEDTKIIFAAIIKKLFNDCKEEIEYKYTNNLFSTKKFNQQSLIIEERYQARLSLLK